VAGPSGPATVLFGTGPPPARREAGRYRPLGTVAAVGGRHQPHQFRQRIPRPPSVAPGDRPNWSALAEEMRRSLPLERVKDAVAHWPEAVANWTEVVPGGDGAATPPAVTAEASFAVLVPLFGADGEATVLLIRRAQLLRRDAGHIAFPGGRVEPGERPVAAALREAREEIGLDPTSITVLRCLEVVERIDGDRVAAFLGVMDGRPELTLNRDEVEAAVEVPLAGLLGDGVGWQERWSFGALERRIHFFADPSMLGDDLIWGLTARILWSLLEGVISYSPGLPG